MLIFFFILLFLFLWMLPALINLISTSIVVIGAIIVLIAYVIYRSIQKPHSKNK